MRSAPGIGRREFLSIGAALGAAGVLVGSRYAEAAEAPPEIRKIRLVYAPSTVCLAPQYLAESLLYAEGFTDIQYVNVERGTAHAAMAEGVVDITMWDALSTLVAIDEGRPIVVLSGVHAGCWELFGTGRIRTISDLKGQSVAIRGFKTGDHILLSSMLAYVGMDPRTDVNWVAGRTTIEAMQLFMDGKASAYMAFAPQPQELRAKRMGHVVVDTVQDRPWSQYFCCVVTARRDFARAYPVATKRALRAILKGADLCSQDPERVARFLVSKGHEPRYEMALEVMRKLPYNRWRDANPEDTLRFHALRLREVGMIKSDPKQLIAQGTDWRFLNELKKELKA